MHDVILRVAKTQASVLFIVDSNRANFKAQVTAAIAAGAEVLGEPVQADDNGNYIQAILTPLQEA